MLCGTNNIPWNICPMLILHVGIFSGILSISQNIVMDLNCTMHMMAQHYTTPLLQRFEKILGNMKFLHILECAMPPCPNGIRG